MREFSGVEGVSSGVLLRFSFELSRGNAEGALAAVRRWSQSWSGSMTGVWRSLAVACVSTARMDVAVACLRQMRKPRSLRALREVQLRERDPRVHRAVLALELGMAREARALLVGFIALLGIAVLNGVVMVTYFNQLRSLGRPMSDVVTSGAERRLRPVLMTASIAAFGLVPLIVVSVAGAGAGAGVAVCSCASKPAGIPARIDPQHNSAANRP
jgi:hypothetical protein